MSGPDDTLDSIPDGEPPRPEPTPGSDSPGTRIGPYTLKRVLGEGGFGVVWLAEQSEPVRRRIALKLIKPGMDSHAVIARFEAERQALALMNHPGVARVHDGGVNDRGRPYFVMELVQGVPITQFCDVNRLDVEARIRLIIQVCAAVQHAHAKGVVHRDLKPGNILVGYEDKQAAPKVIDFGIAKALDQALTDKTLHTQHGQLIGTPEYMSPEQAMTSHLDVDTRSDVYSLGVILYELLVGATPFDSKALRASGIAEVQRIIREVEPPRPSTRLSTLAFGEEAPETGGELARARRTDPRALGRRLRGDLDWIVMKCLEKDRERRYDTPDALAADLRRYLTDEPVEAGPPSAVYRARKFVRRNRAGVLAASLVLAALLAGVVGTGWGMVRARAAQAEAQQRADELEIVTDFQSSMLSDVDAEAMGLTLGERLRENLRASLERDGTDEPAVRDELARLDASVSRANPTNIALDLLDEHVLQRAADAIEADFADRPVIRASLQQTLVATYFALGLYGPAYDVQTAALATRRATLGEEHPDTLSSMNNMGFVLEARGEWAEAETIYREALGAARRTLGSDNDTTLSLVSNLGYVLLSEGKLAEAEPLHHEHLDQCRRLYGEDDQITLVALNNMAYLLQEQGELAEAEALYREGLETSRRVLGDDHPDTLISVANVGTVLEEQGKHAEAEPYYLEDLEGCRRILGDDHPDTMNALNNMGYLLEELGRLDEAERYYREAMDRKRRVLGDDHPGTLLTIGNVSVVLMSQGKLDEAETLCLESLEGYRRVVGDDHLGTMRALNTLGLLRNKTGEHDQAESLRLEALAGFGRLLGSDHPETVRLAEDVLEFYAQRHAAEPDAGYDAKADALRREFSGLDDEAQTPANDDP